MGARSTDADRGGVAANSTCAERLRRSADVRAAFAARGAGTSRLVVHGRRRPDDGAPRATVVAGKAVGNAVRRNRVKRRLRAALAQAALPQGFDLVVVGRPIAADAAFDTLRADLENALTKLVGRS